jgi:CheY-like chemotaxis protein
MDNATPRKRILIVDDEIDFTYVMRLTLEGTGQYQVRTLNTATQVVSVARDFRPHLILLDCMMPGQDGGEVAAALQKDPLLKDTPFAFFTATVSEPETVTSRCYEGPHRAKDRQRGRPRRSWRPGRRPARSTAPRGRAPGVAPFR